MCNSGTKNSSYQKRWVILFILLIFQITGISQTQQWSVTEGPQVGDIRDIDIAGTNIWLAADCGGVYLSTDGGYNFVNKGLVNMNVFSIKADGSDLYAGTYGGGFYYSSDQGTTWISRGVSSVTHSQIEVNGPYVYSATAKYLYRSTDRGITWQILNNANGLPLNANCRTVFFKDSTIYVGTWNSGAFRSTDNGATFTAINNGLTNLNVWTFTNIGDSVFCGTAPFGGISVTTDNGNTWEPANNGMTDYSVVSLLTVGNNIYAGLANLGGVCISTNMGNSWVRINNGIPVTVTRSLAVSGDKVFCGTWNKGLYATTNNGTSWTTQNRGIASALVYKVFNHNNKLYAGTSAGLYVTSDGGGSWDKLEAELGDREVWSIAATETKLFAGTYPNTSNSGGLYYSTNNGTSWVRTNLDTTEIFSTLITSGNYIIGGGWLNGIYRSSDDGLTWSVKNTGLTDTWIQALYAYNGNLYAGTYSGIFVSTNNGDNWALSNTGLTTTNVTAITSIDSNLFAGTSNGMFKSTNNGVNWTVINTGLTFKNVMSLASYETTLYAGLSFKGVYASTNYGASWTQFRTGLPYTNTMYPSIQSMCVLNGKLYAGLYQGSVWQYQVASTFQLTVNVENGWNLVSAPGIHPTNQEVLTWWSGKDPAANVFKYSGSYQSVSVAAPAEGYWMKNVGAQTYNTGDEWPAGGILFVPANAISANAGWNLFGGYDYIAPVAGITTNPPGLIEGSIFKYSGGYQTATELVPGYGYWVKLSGAGQIILPPSTFQSTLKITNNVKTEWGRIIVTDNTGKSFTLYAADDESDLNSFELPPLPPSGMFDVRYGSGKYAEDISSGIQSIELKGIEYPVKVKVENMSIRMQDETGKLINAELRKDEEITIANSSVNKLMILSGEIVETLPAEYSLEQNFPNPFNPSTTIKFSLPEGSANIKLTIYNSLGQKVAELVNGKLDAGIYSYQWDAGDVSSGLYIYQVVTDKFISTKKMMLIK